ncbi:MAG: archease [Thermoguttaceae bacterium]|jgi:SHS2 domain-containing protein
MFETFDHTADVGLRIRAADLDTLFVDAAQAMFSVMADDLGAVRPTEEVRITLGADDLDALLRDWLGELLYTFHVRKLVFSDFTVAVCERGLQGTARGEPMDEARHKLDVEIKAVTWHGLKVERTSDGWLAEFIVDI